MTFLLLLLQADGGTQTADAAAGDDDFFDATWCGCGFSLFGGEDGRR